MSAILRLVGGPLEGDRAFAGAWPPPEELQDGDKRGRYVKVSQSQLTDDVPGVIRGAEYRWEPKIREVKHERDCFECAVSDSGWCDVHSPARDEGDYITYTGDEYKRVP